MINIRIHRVDNTVYGRYHSPWFKKFSEYLSQYFNVEWKDYATTPTDGYAIIELQSELRGIGNKLSLSDVDCVIENLDTKKYVVLSFTEYFNSYVVHYLKSDNCQKVLLTHFSYTNIYHWLKRDYLTNKMDVVSPWFFGKFDDYDHMEIRNHRQGVENLSEGLFYKGSGQGYREVVNILHNEGLLNRESVPFNEYLKQMSEAKLGLSYYMDLDKYNTPYDHTGEFCYRDMEYMSVGLPFIRVEYKDNLYDGLIPNYHYITIPREKAYVAYELGGNSKVAELIKEKYNEVKDDTSFLNFISKNQIEWFDKYLSWPNSAKFTMELTGINEWI
jgi:hypothetical protein